MGSRVTDKYYECIPEKVVNVNSTTIMWNPIITDQTILANWPAVLLQDKKEKTCLLIDIVVILDDLNVKTKETEKLSAQRPGDRSQQDVESEEKRIMPVITGALGTITKG